MRTKSRSKIYYAYKEYPKPTKLKIKIMDFELFETLQTMGIISNVRFNRLFPADDYLLDNIESVTKQIEAAKVN